MTSPGGNESVEDSMAVFVSDVVGPESYVGFFEDDGESGYLYVSDRTTNVVIKHLQIYDCANILKVREEDVRVVWSVNGTKCAVSIWDGIRGIIDLAKGVEGRAKLTSRSTPPISDSAWLSGF